MASKKVWTLGFSKECITPTDYKEHKYYSAGYIGGCRITEILNDTYVRAIYIDDNSGNGGVAIAVVDCVGMTNLEVLDIRARLEDFKNSTNIREINVLFTHCHSAPDTFGLWGKLPRSGVVKHYNEIIKDLAAKAVQDAYNNRKSGKLYIGEVETEGLMEDTREPIVFDNRLTRIRFEPADKSLDFFIIHLPVHPEVLGPRNPKSSPDFPAYMGEYIGEKTGSDFIFINGAIGGQIVCPGLDEIYAKTVDNVEECKKFGIRAGEYALSIEQERELAPNLVNIRKEIKIPICNIKFVLAHHFKLIRNKVEKISRKDRKPKSTRYVINSELGYMEIGDVKIMLVPGELYPELAMGGFLDKDNSANGYDMEVKTLYDIMGDGRKMIFGLANDEVGYIIPANDYCLHKKLPYIIDGYDRLGRKHYEETNCTGVYTAETILNEAEVLLNDYKKGDK